MMCAAHADSYTVSGSASSGAFDGTATISWSGAVSLAKFDGSLGTLTSVSVSATWNTTEQMIIQNTTPSISQAFVQYTAEVDLTMPGAGPTFVGAAPPLTFGS